VFTTRAVRAGQVLEVAPVLVVPDAQRPALERTRLREHVWEWDDGVAVGLGLISLVNHGVPGNARWESDVEAGELWLSAVDDLPAGAEVLVDYTLGGEIELWFTPR
jgi:hypothetical protein